jgi:hypothetical protein
MTPSPIYQIRIAGLLDSSWTDWFDGLAITLGFTRFDGQ